MFDLMVNSTFPENKTCAECFLKLPQWVIEWWKILSRDYKHVGL